MSDVLTLKYNVAVNSDELIGTREYPMLWMRCRINRSCYNRVRLYMYICTHVSSYVYVFACVCVCVCVCVFVDILNFCY